MFRISARKVRFEFFGLFGNHRKMTDDRFTVPKRVVSPVRNEILLIHRFSFSVTAKHCFLEILSFSIFGLFDEKEVKRYRCSSEDTLDW